MPARMDDPDLPPILRASHRLLRRRGVCLLVRRDWESALPVEAMLAGAPLEAWGQPVPHGLRGRDTLHVLATPHGELVAKRLSRGGIVGALARHSYADPARPLREAAAAESLRQRGLVTPPVVAARATRAGPLWTIELATQRLPAEGDLLDCLRAHGPAASLARAAGRTLRRAHDAGLHHRDLQVKNLLVPAGFPGPGGPDRPHDLVLLDLDRCRVGQPLNVAERLASLARFARSLVKHGFLRPPGAEIRLFLRAYGGLPGHPPARLLELVGGRVRREVARHRWLWR